MDNKILIQKELAKLARRRNPNGRRARLNRKKLARLGWTEEAPVTEAPKPKTKPKAKKKATKK